MHCNAIIKMRRMMWVWMLVTVGLVINQWCTHCCYGCLEEEKIGLLNIKAWIDPQGSHLANWMGDDCCAWFGVYCDATARQVIDINLQGVWGYSSVGNLYLNASLLLPFKELQTLDLSFNTLVGCFENQGFEVLASSLKKLEALHLAYNKFNETILSSLSDLSSLKYLNLSGNMLTGSTGIKGLKKLEVLRVDEIINMTGSILLESLGVLPSLKTLSAEGSNLTAGHGLYGLTKLEALFLDLSPLPANFLQSIGTLSDLKVLSLSFCNLGGTLPTLGWCELKKLERLYLDANNLEGRLPACMGNLSSLQLLDVSDNQFFDNVASGPLAHLTSLQMLWLSSNHFELPVSFKPFMKHSNLKFMSCDYNKLITEPADSFQYFVPKLQLQYFSSSNCTSHSQTPNAEIPNFLYTQRDLRVVDLSYNGFHGIVPSWLFENNTRLERVTLNHNFFVGRLRLPFHPNLNLSVLEISNNNIHGQVPTNMCLIFPKLIVLKMADNRLNGPLASCFGNISYLRGLDLSNNQFSEVKLDELLTSSSLEILILSNNSLGGQIPPSFFDSFEFSFVSVLDISDNHFSGMLPRWIGNLSSLVEIDFSNNQFEGPIPQNFCKLQHLEFFDLSVNRLSGSIPLCFDPPKLSHVHLYKNQFSGPLAHIFHNSSSLLTLDLAHNNFTGPIPNSVGNFSALSFLVLKANHLHGKLPVQLFMLKQLSIFDVSRNNLSGPLHSYLGNLTFRATTLKDFDTYINVPYQSSIDSDSLLRDHINVIKPISGDDKFISSMEHVEFTTKRVSYSYRGNILDFMSGFDFSCNNFTGKIPMEIGYLSELRALNLSHNHLTGSIPTTFSNLKQIESLDISYNKLTGDIPLQLTELTTLEVFSVAYNNLSGKTPERKNQFGTFDADCYKGNPLLCGPPLQNSCSESVSPPQPMPNDSNGKEEEDGFIDMNVFYATFGVCYLIVVLTIAAILYINPYWRRRWFYFIEWCIDSGYYFVLDCFLSKLSNFRCL